MSLITLLLLAVALGTDAFSLAVGIGLRGVTNREVVRVSATIGVFHIMMPLVGLYLGQLFGKIVGDAASFFGALILIVLGIRMIREGCKSRPHKRETVQLFGWSLIMFALSVSLDALSVGFSLGTVAQDIIRIVLILGLTSMLMTAIGLKFGSFLGGFVGERAELLGGLVLVAVGIKILW